MCISLIHLKHCSVSVQHINTIPQCHNGVSNFSLSACMDPHASTCAGSLLLAASNRFNEAAVFSHNTTTRQCHNGVSSTYSLRHTCHMCAQASLLLWLPPTASTRLLHLGQRSSTHSKPPPLQTLLCFATTPQCHDTTVSQGAAPLTV